MKQLPILYGFYFILFCLYSCNKKNHLRDAVFAMKKTGQFVTAEYILTKIVKASDDKTWYKVGNRKILMSLEAKLKAGIDLQAINEKDFIVEDSLLSVTLPHAKIFSLSIPPEKIKLEYQKIDLLRDDFSAAERENLLVQAQIEIRKLADSLKILNTAEENAAVFLEKLLQQSGYQSVRVAFADK